MDTQRDFLRALTIDHEDVKSPVQGQVSCDGPSVADCRARMRMFN